MAMIQLMLLPWMSLSRVTWYLVFQIWISGHLSLVVTWNRAEKIPRATSKGRWITGAFMLYVLLSHVLMRSSQLDASQLRLSYTSTFSLGAHLPCMPPVFDTLFGRLPHLHQHNLNGFTCHSLVLTYSVLILKNFGHGWWAGSSFALVRFENATHCIVSPQLVGYAWAKSLSCLLMDIQYVAPLLSGLRLKKGPFVLFACQVVYSESGVW
jgi:hypothetical protein